MPQLYILQKYGSTCRPVMQLRAFSRRYRKSGETRKRTFYLTGDQLRSWTSSEKWAVEKSEYEILIGASSGDIRLKGAVKI